MNPRRNVLVAVVALAVSVIPAFANLWQGTITETITQTDDPLFSIGDTFMGYYQYDSTTIDGVFGTQNYVDSHPGAVATLKGTLDSMRQGNIQIENSIWALFTHLTVVDGVVTEFYKTGQNGASDYTFGTSLFSYLFPTNTNHSGTLHTYGKMVISNPTSADRAPAEDGSSDPESVPDSVSTAAMMSLTMIALAFIRRRFASKKIA